MDVFSRTMTNPGSYGVMTKKAADRLALGGASESTDIFDHIMTNTTMRSQGMRVKNLESYVKSDTLSGAESTVISDRTFMNPGAMNAGRTAQGGNLRSTADHTMIWRESELRDTGNVGKMDPEIILEDPKPTMYQYQAISTPTVYSWK